MPITSGERNRLGESDWTRLGCWWSSRRIQVLAAGSQASGRGPSIASSHPRASACSAAPEGFRVTVTSMQRSPTFGRLRSNSSESCTRRLDFSSDDVTASWTHGGGGAIRATVLTVDGPYASSYRYRYVVGDRVCRGEASSDKPIPAPETQVLIHYDPKNVCQSVTYDPVGNLVGGVIGLASISALLAFMTWNYWPPKGPE